MTFHFVSISLFMKIKSSAKQVFKQSRILALAAALAVAGCKGEDGEIGPKGETGPQGAVGATGPSSDKAYENGFIKGTLKGTRRDGTAFEEAFEYKITTDASSFEKISGTEHRLSLWRSLGLQEYNSGISMHIVVTNKDQAGATAVLERASMEFTKTLANRTNFYLNAGTNFKDGNITLPMSRTHNATYKLVEHGFQQQSYEDPATDKSYYVVKDTDGNSIYFENSYNYDAVRNVYFSPFAYVVNNSGVKSTTSTLWGNVRMIRSENWIKNFATTAGVNLFETVAVPADTREITNFAYNPTTGVVTFDYKINISELRAYDRNYYNASPANTTLHPLEIKGSVSATVYNSTVMRQSAQ